MEPLQKSFYISGKAQRGAALANGIQHGELTGDDSVFILSLRRYTQKNPVPVDAGFRLFRLCIRKFAQHLPPVVAVTAAAQFILESGSGRAQTGNFNFGGIKANRAQIEKYEQLRANGVLNDDVRMPCRVCLTTECDISPNIIAAYERRGHYVDSYVRGGSVVHRVYDYFENYQSLDGYFLRKANLLKSTKNAAGKNYSLCLTAPTVDVCIQRIYDAGYATATGYVKSILSVIDMYNKIAYYGTYERNWLLKDSLDAVDEFGATCNAEVDPQLFSTKAYSAYLKWVSQQK